MTSYVAYYGKKRERLAKHERELMKLLKAGTNQIKIIEAAGIVRAAHIRVIKSRIGELQPWEKNAAAIAEFQRDIQHWLDMSIDAVIETHRKKLSPNKST